VLNVWQIRILWGQGFALPPGFRPVFPGYSNRRGDRSFRDDP
jgi:hypothetical protein